MNLSFVSLSIWDGDKVFMQCLPICRAVSPGYQHSWHPASLVAVSSLCNKFLKMYTYFYLCMCVSLHVCICNTSVQVPMEARREHWITWDSRCCLLCTAQCGYWGLNLGLLQEQELDPWLASGSYQQTMTNRTDLNKKTHWGGLHTPALILPLTLPALL